MHLWILTLLVVLFGFVNGALITATPLACLELNVSSQTLGLVGAILPLAYGLTCLSFGRLFRRVPGKYVLLGGATLAAASALLMGAVRAEWSCVVGYFGYGVACGSFWPFISAWMLDFQGPTVTKTRVLRHYNVGWTSGTSTGMYIAGVVSEHGHTFGVFLGCALILLPVVVLACLPPATHPAGARGVTQTGARPPARLGLTLFLAAILANLMVLGTRGLITVNYAELNAFLAFGKDRMGLFGAAMILSQLVAFAGGAFYEHFLGLRRTYLFIVCSVAIVNLTFAFQTSLPVLVAAMLLQGLTAALAFQTSMVASTAYFHSPRTGTTVHETFVGLSGFTALAAGALVGACKARGLEPLAALRAPLLVLPCLAGLVLAAQMLLIGRRREERVLLPKQEV